MSQADRYLKIIEKHLDKTVKDDELKCANCDKPLSIEKKTGDRAIIHTGYVQHIIRANDELRMSFYCGSICCYLHLAAQIEHVQKERLGYTEEE